MLTTRPYTANSREVVRDKGRGPQMDPVHHRRCRNRAEGAGCRDGVWVTNSGDVSQRVLASHAMALMLGVMRNFRRFEQLRPQREWARNAMSSHILDPDGARLVILGMGHIGQDIARKAKAFDMEVICVTRAAAPAVPEIDRVVPREQVDEVLPGRRRGAWWRMPVGRQRPRSFSVPERIALHEEDGDPRQHLARPGQSTRRHCARALAEDRVNRCRPRRPHQRTAAGIRARFGICPTS